jgi:alanine racemase
MPGLELEGLWSHFAMGEMDRHPFTAHQTECFTELCERVQSAGIDVRLRHLTSSASTVLYPDAHFDLVRLGIMLYGLYPHAALERRCELVPAMRLASAVGLVRRVPAGEGVSYGLRYRLERPSTIASLPLGYADGWLRRLSGRADVLIGGRRRPAVGTVCMDSFMVDLGDDECEVGDEAVLIGSQGDERITADELAERSETINYEIVTSVSARVPRVYAGP